MPYNYHRSRRYYPRRKNNYHEQPSSSWSDYILPFVRGAASAIPYGKIFEGIYSGASEVYKDYSRKARHGTTYERYHPSTEWEPEYEEVIRPGWGKY